MSSASQRVLSPPAHWPRSLEQARRAQAELAGRVRPWGRLNGARLAAGVDVSYPRNGGAARAAVALLALPGLELVDSAVVRMRVEFPYISGYLSFREVPPALAALAALELKPDVLVCDGQGLAHPRGLGLACHLGLAAGLPSVGVAKSRLVGDYAEPGPRRGDWSPLRHRGRVVGVVLRTRDGVRPLFVSPGHRVGLKAAVELTLSLHAGFRLPQTTRLAHRLAAGLAP